MAVYTQLDIINYSLNVIIITFQLHYHLLVVIFPAIPLHHQCHLMFLPEHDRSRMAPSLTACSLDCQPSRKQKKSQNNELATDQ